MTLQELELAYEPVAVDCARPVKRAAACLALKPQRLLPVSSASDQDAAIFEPAAILLYPADREGRLGATHRAAHGRALKWLLYLSKTPHADLRLPFYAERHVADRATVPALREGALTRIESHLRLLDAAIGESGGAWLLGQRLSVLVSALPVRH
jgi:glutathione S-transferase